MRYVLGYTFHRPRDHQSLRPSFQHAGQLFQPPLQSTVGVHGRRSDRHVWRRHS